MLSPDDDKLRWVQRNHGPRKPRDIRAGQHLANLTAWVGKRTADSGAAEAAELLVDAVDEEFRRYCRVVSCKHGQLVIAVENTSLRFAMRARWGALLLKALEKTKQFRSIKKVDFQPGRVGVLVPSNLEH